MDERIARVRGHPAYRRLVVSRRRLAWTLSAIMLIAFDKDLLATPIGGGAITLGIPIGFGLIVLGVALTAYYVRVANRDHDALLATLLAETAE